MMDIRFAPRIVLIVVVDDQRNVGSLILSIFLSDIWEGNGCGATEIIRDLIARSLCRLELTEVRISLVVSDYENGMHVTHIGVDVKIVGYISHYLRNMVPISNYIGGAKRNMDERILVDSVID